MKAAFYAVLIFFAMQQKPARTLVWYITDCPQNGAQIFAKDRLEAIAKSGCTVWSEEEWKSATIQTSGSALFNEKLIISPEVWREIESHCVAVLTEAHVEERPVATYGDIAPEVRDGKAIIHVPEQTLKLRCQ
jgi:hypothetical protein